MPKEKTKGNEVLEEALKESCESYPDRYPRYEGNIDLGKDYARYEKRLLRREKSPLRYGGGRRISVLAASFILFFACSMAAVWLGVILYVHTEMPPDYPTSGSQSIGTTPGTRPTPTGSSGTTFESLNTDSSDSISVTPPVVPDETSAIYRVIGGNGDGLQIEVTVYGYQRTNMKRRFYVKNNEFIIVDVEITNLSAVPVYQWLPTACRNSDPAHNHEIGFELVSGEYKLSSSSAGFACPEAVEIWEIEPGATHEWKLKLAAGEVKSGDEYDLPIDGTARRAGIDLFETDIYIDGACVFAGTVAFDYMKTEDGHGNAFSVSVPLEMNVVFVSSDPATADKS